MKKVITFATLLLLVSVIVATNMYFQNANNNAYAESYGDPNSFSIYDTRLYLPKETGVAEYYARLGFYFSWNRELYEKLSETGKKYIKYEGIPTQVKYERSLYLIRTESVGNFYSSSYDDFGNNADYLALSYPIENFDSCIYTPSGRGDVRTYDEFDSLNTDTDKKYIYYVVILEKQSFANYSFYSEVAKTSNYISVSYREMCEEKLKSEEFDNLPLESSMYAGQLKAMRKICGYSTDSGLCNITFNYRSLINDNTNEITWKTENYQVENLKSLSRTYVYSKILQLCGKSILSDFNVIRREVGYTVNGNSESAFLQDEYTLLEANGYDYVFDKNKNEGTLTITYGDYAAKDFPLVVRTNDELHSALFIRSGDIKTNGEKTTITFDTSNIKTRLSNNFSWNVDNTDFNNYVINNPHGNKVKFTKNNSGSDVSSITVETSDTNLLADCSLRLEIEVVPPVELTVTVKYLELKYSNGEFAETWKTKVLPNKIWSTQYTKINKVSFFDGDESIGIPAQGAFVNQNIAVSLDGKNIERLTYDGVTLSAADNTTATAMITVKYVRNTLFRILDSYTNKYTFVKAYGNSLNYSGADFIVEHDGYRVKSIVSENQQFAKVITTDGVYNWNNATIAIVCQLSAGNVIPLTVVYTDKWVVNVEYLDNYFSSIGDTSKPTGFAVKKTFDGEIKIKDDNGNLAFADINNPTGEEVAKFLGKGSVADLTVVGTFGAVKDISVSFANDVFTIRLSYHDTTLKILQADGTYEFVNIPFSCYGTWANSYGKDWSILALNTKDNVVFGSAGDIDRDSLYGYFYVSVFKEQVKNLDDLFAGYAADGCRSFYDCKKVVGSELYKRCSQMGTLGTILCLGTNKLVQAAGEILHDDYGTYYSYFLFVDGSSTLAYSANNKADNYFDHDSAIDNTIEDIGGDLAKWLDDNFGKVKSVLIVVGSIVLLCFVGVSVSKIIANIGNSGRRKRK